VEWRISSLSSWFLSLLLLNILDILVTNPTFESNPFTLYMWGKVGILLSAGIKIGLVLFFGILCILTKRVARPAEWAFASRLLRGTLIALVAFYIFVVAWNMIQYILFLFL
jgi:hypothetical protein